MPNTAAVTLIAARLPNGLVHPGDGDKQPAKLIPLPGLSNLGLPQGMAEHFAREAGLPANDAPRLSFIPPRFRPNNGARPRALGHAFCRRISPWGAVTLLGRLWWGSQRPSGSVALGPTRRAITRSVIRSAARLSHRLSHRSPNRP